MAFRFRLERVLEWRRTTLHLEQARLENLRGQLRALETARADLIEQRLQMQRAIATSAQIAGQDLARLDAFRRWAEREEIALAQRIVEAGRAIEAQAARVVGADRDVRLVERLREKQRHAWSAEEQKALDEMAGESAVAQWRRKTADSVR